MLTLLEQSKYLQNPLQKGVIQVYVRSTPVLEKLPFVQVNGNAYQYNVEDALPNVGFRAVNTPYEESHGTIQRKTEAIKIFGGTTKIDKFLVASQGNINDIRSIQTEMAATAAALLFTKSFFKGDSSVDANEFDGLEKRLAGDQVLDGSQAAIIGDLTTIVDKLIDRVVGGPDMLFMSADMRRALNASMRLQNQAIETISDVFGRQVQAYAGVQIGVIEHDNKGLPILTNDIYACRFGAGSYVSGLQVGPLTVTDQGERDVWLQTLIEWYASIAVFHPRAAARISGLPTFIS